jgi:hypothetical protein
MSDADVEAAAFSKPGQKITIQYGATPATVEKVGNTPSKQKQTWAMTAAYVIGFLVIVAGATLMYRHYMADDKIKTSEPAAVEFTGPAPDHSHATGNILEDIKNGVTNMPFGNPTLEEMKNTQIKVDTGFVDEDGDPVFSDGQGHVAVDEESIGNLTAAPEPVEA